MFASLQQKDISGLLTSLWHADPFKSKWTLLAKAYSIIRDRQGKQDCPLDIFLIINAPFVGIVPPKEYMTTLGWELMDGEGDNCTLVRRYVPDLKSFNKNIVGTGQSVYDIVQHSYEQGYIPADGGSFKLSGPMPAAHNMMLSQIPTPQVITPQVTISVTQPTVTVNSEAAAHSNTDLNMSMAESDGDKADPVAAAEPTIGDDILIAENDTAIMNGVSEITGTTEQNVEERDLARLERELIVELDAELRRMNEEEKAQEEAAERHIAQRRREIAARFTEADASLPFTDLFDCTACPELSLDPYDISKFIEPEYLVD